MKILNFKSFESYLSSGKQPLYHTTNIFRLKEIMNSDLLKMSGRVARGPEGICVTRNINWTNDGSIEVRLVLDSDLLLRDGYKSFPIQELQYNKGAKYREGRRDIRSNVWKGNLDLVKNGQRMHPHNISSLPKERLMEVEFEERFFKNIKNIGKYIIFIDISDEDIITKTMRSPDYITNYLKKYPQIKFRLLTDIMNPYKTKEVDINDIIKTRELADPFKEISTNGLSQLKKLLNNENIKI